MSQHLTISPSEAADRLAIRCPSSEFLGQAVD